MTVAMIINMFLPGCELDGLIELDHEKFAKPGLARYQSSHSGKQYCASRGRNSTIWVCVKDYMSSIVWTHQHST
jgi:hypothetical protein